MRKVSPDRKEVLACVEHVLGSDIFSRSPQARRFIRYVVDRALDDDADGLKAYTIGVHALGVNSNRSNPETTARMQASRVRRLLLRYYEGVGRQDSLEMRLPVGGYEPQFISRAPPRALDGENLSTFPTIFFEDFENLTQEAQDSPFCRGLGDEISELLVQVAALRVAHHSVPDTGTHNEFVLSGSLTRSGNDIRISCRLRCLFDGERVWSHHFDAELNDRNTLEVQDQLALLIASQVGDPAFGALARAHRQITLRHGPLTPAQSFYRLLCAPNAASLKSARSALEASLPEGDALHHACAACVMALHYCSAPANRSADLLSAESLARTAMDQDSECALAHLAKALVHYLHHERGPAEREFALAMEYERASTSVAALAGNFIALMGNWELGLGIVNQAQKIEPRLPSYLQTANFLYLFYERSDPARALVIAESLELKDSGWGALLEACCLSILDRPADSRRAISRALKASPQLAKRMSKHLSAVLFIEEMAERLTEAAGDAGLMARYEKSPRTPRYTVPATPRALPSEIRVGILHSLTGPMALSETHLVNAAMLAIEEINAAGGVLGRPVRGIVEDGASDPRVFEQKAERLVKEDGVTGIFGCWLSSSRKAVLPIVERHGLLLWYPLQYEGLEDSRNIVYTGSCLNQQIEPAVRWAFRQNRRRCFLVGSDYVYPRTANHLIRGLVEAAGGEVVGEHYEPLGRANFEEVATTIARTGPDIVYNTVNGADNIALLRALSQASVTANESPLMSFSLSELELAQCGKLAQGHLACWSYFRSSESPENLALVAKFRRRYGDSAVLSDPSVTAYAQMHLWKDVAERAGCLDAAALLSHLNGSQLSLGGEVLDVCENNHVERRAIIGEVGAGHDFHIKWRSNRRIAPKPWLGVEESDPKTRQLVLTALRALPTMAEQNSFDLRNLPSRGVVG